MSFSQVTFAQSDEARSPMLYGLGSFVIPGLGQLLQAEPQKALIHFGVAIAIPVVGTLAAIASPVPELVGAITGLASLGWAVLSSIDAYRLAQQYNDANGYSAYQINAPV